MSTPSPAVNSGTSAPVVITPEQLRTQWQGHRSLTRRVIDAFPDEQLFTFSVAGMRPFAEMAMEFIRMGAPGARGAATGEWVMDKTETPKTKPELLALWDSATASIDEWFTKIPIARFQAHEVAYGQWPSTIIGVLLYAIDNEVHHRGQGYVYLRALNIEPPAFYDR